MSRHKMHFDVSVAGEHVLDDKKMTLWPIERRVLGYLDQRGPTHRERAVIDLSSNESKTGWRRDRGHVHGGGSNGGAPLLMGAWTRRLTKWGWVRQASTRDGFYLHHEITPAGRRGLRESANA